MKTFLRRSMLIAMAGLSVLRVEAAEYITVGGGSFASVLPLGGDASSKLTDAPLPVDLPSFAMRTEPVTNAEFLAFVELQPAWRRDRVAPLFADSRYLSHWQSADTLGDEARPDQPVTRVSWFAAEAYCESEHARLPTWHEWEYAAAADETRRDARDDPVWRERILNWYAKPSRAALGRIGQAPNVFGIRDLHGLIWEWVDDAGALLVASDSRAQNDPDKARFCGAGALDLKDRNNYAVLMRIALLSSLKAADTTGNLGFRCARSSL